MGQELTTRDIPWEIKRESHRNPFLDDMPGYQGRFLRGCVNSVVEFSNRMYQDHFAGCGMYAVGSSVVGGSDPNDFDIVLVGLDFRSILQYDKQFLKDPETLIEKGVLVEPVCFDILEGNEADPRLLRASSQGDSINGIGRQGIEHNGKVYDFHIDHFAYMALDLDSYCSKQSEPSRLVEAIRGNMQGPRRTPGHFDSPFEMYFHGEDYFLTTSFMVEPIDGPDSMELTPHGEDLPCAPVHFIFHAENLRRDAWKKYQGLYGMPFVPLYEWADMEGERPVITELDLPEFVDSNGIKRVKYDPYFLYLREAPIAASSEQSTKKSSLPSIGQV